jgi:membrane-bound serine protease (ClpP class)
VTSYGLLTVGGAASLVFGSMILVDSSAPELQLDLRLILPVVGAVVVIAALLVRLAVSSQRQRAVTGEAGMIGQSGRTLAAFEPGGQGRITTRGEIWKAVSEESIPADTPVRIVAVDGLTLWVRKE